MRATVVAEAAYGARSLDCAMSTIPEDVLLEYAANMFRRFPEEFLALGAPEVDVAYDLKKAVRYRADHMSGTTVAVALPRCYSPSPSVRRNYSTSDYAAIAFARLLAECPALDSATFGVRHAVRYRADDMFGTTIAVTIPRRCPFPCPGADHTSSTKDAPRDDPLLGGLASSMGPDAAEVYASGGPTFQEFSICGETDGTDDGTSAHSLLMEGLPQLEHTQTPSEQESSPTFQDLQLSSNSSNASDCMSKSDDEVSAMPSVKMASLELQNYFEGSSRLRGNTVIILDWDDTLFPTTWVCEHMKLQWSCPCPPLDEYVKPLAAAEEQALKLVAAATRLAATVAIVTLARQPWVETTCRNFYPSMHRALLEHDLPVVYARDVTGGAISGQCDQVIPGTTSANGSVLKGRAIARLCTDRSPLLPAFGVGGVWGVNVLSIGDSTYEAEGLKLATEQWAFHNHRTAERLPRPKTVKMLDEPAVCDVRNQLRLIVGWLGAMVRTDVPFNLDLADIAKQDPSGGNYFIRNHIELFFAALDLEKSSSDAVVEARLWKPKSDEDATETWHWLPRRMWLSRSGRLWYESMHHQSPMMHFGGYSVADLKIRPALPGETVTNIKGQQVWGIAFQLPLDGPTRYLAVESIEERDQFLEAFASFAE
mmetsp:Transcript_733/g.1571  ORF Transcript_733/g.1571 Transcript_733/m.1571 type:complete len:652 (-) Transcript_733:121-2076(-)